ncbi:EVE domain-containing protein, partial [Pseudoalteromonas sp. Z1A8]|uniref:EVE domain-containing protein n=1 Tax=Pseudoalteromonas sp. Z1A8 TaxID=2686354 RepID=UPI001F0F7574
IFSDCFFCIFKFLMFIFIWLSLNAVPFYPDPTQFDLSSDYYDAKATSDKPRWVVVEVTYQSHLNKLVSLKDIKANNNITEIALKKGGRLSIMPVTKNDWDEIIKMAQ